MERTHERASHVVLNTHALERANDDGQRCRGGVARSRSQYLAIARGVVSVSFWATALLTNREPTGASTLVSSSRRAAFTTTTLNRCGRTLIHRLARALLCVPSSAMQPAKNGGSGW